LFNPTWILSPAFLLHLPRTNLIRAFATHSREDFAGMGNQPDLVVHEIILLWLVEI
jgi:hypothetical protein